MGLDGTKVWSSERHWHIMLQILALKKPSSGKFPATAIFFSNKSYFLFLKKIWGTSRKASSCCWHVQDTILLPVSCWSKITDWDLSRVCGFFFPSCLLLISFRGRIPSFDDFLDGSSKARPFSNCLTLTNDDFANFQHRDKDHIAVAFGLWWASAQAFTPEGQPVYSFPSGIDHDKIDGGGFLWGEYGIGMDFQRYVKVNSNLLESYLIWIMQCSGTGGNLLEGKAWLPLHNAQQQSWGCYSMGHISTTNPTWGQCCFQVLEIG